MVFEVGGVFDATLFSSCRITLRTDAFGRDAGVHQVDGILGNDDEIETAANLVNVSNGTSVLFLGFHQQFLFIVVVLNTN